MIIVHIEDYFDPNAGYQVNEFLRIKFHDLNQIVITSNDMTPFHKNVDTKSDTRFSEEFGVKIIRLEVILKFSNRLVLRDLWKTVVKEEPDLVFLHGIGDFKDFILPFRKINYKLVRDCHMSWSGVKNPFSKYYLKLFSIFQSPLINASTNYSKIFALGTEEKDYLQKMGISEKKIEILPHGYNSNYFYYDVEARNSIRKEFNYTENDIVISYIGKFDNMKRPDYIFDIIDDKIIENFSLKFLFIGAKDSTYMNDIFNKKSVHIDKQNIVILDSKPYDELRHWFSASDICIYPKQTTLSSIHAQVCGTTVIMEKQISNIERVVNKENLYEIDNLNDAKRILNRILSNKEYLKSINLNLVASLKKREYTNQIKQILDII